MRQLGGKPTGHDQAPPAEVRRPAENRPVRLPSSAGNGCDGRVLAAADPSGRQGINDHRPGRQHPAKCRTEPSPHHCVMSVRKSSGRQPGAMAWRRQRPMVHTDDFKRDSARKEWATAVRFAALGRRSGLASDSLTISCRCKERTRRCRRWAHRMPRHSWFFTRRRQRGGYLTLSARCPAETGGRSDEACGRAAPSSPRDVAQAD